LYFLNVEKKKKKNYYEKLDLPQDASQREIKRAYFQLAREYHPDKMTSEPKEKVHARFMEFAHAYEILSDPKKRERYDKLLAMGQVVYYDDTAEEHVFREEEEQQHEGEYKFTDAYQTYDNFFTNIEKDKDFEYFQDSSSNSALYWSSGAILLVIGGLVSMSYLKTKQNNQEREKIQQKILDRSLKEEEKQKKSIKRKKKRNVKE